MLKKIEITLLLVSTMLFSSIIAYADCTYSGTEIPNNFIDEDCDGWIDGDDYNMRSTHPRLFIDEDNIDIIRSRAASVQRDVYSSIKDYCDQYMGETRSVFMDGWDRRSLRYALIYALGEIDGFSYSYPIEDYGNKAKDIILMLVRGSGSSGDMYYQGDEDSVAIVYDWIYDLLSESEKQEIIDYFDDEIGTLDIASKAQGYRFGGGLPEGIIPGLAFYADGIDDIKAKEYVDFIYEWQNELKALEHMSGGDGGHGDALGYFSAYMDGQNYDVTYGFRALETATGLDMLKDSSYMLNAPFIYFYGHKPHDHKVVPFGDVSPGSWLYNKHLFLTEDAYIQFRLIAEKYYELGDQNSASFVTWLIEDFFDMDHVENPFELVANIHSIDKKSPAELQLPVCKAFGWNESSDSIAMYEGNKAGIGWVIMRSAWQGDDPTYAVFKAEPYFYHGHQHVDSLAFYISKGEELALASAGMYFYWYEGGAIEEGGTIGHPHHWYYFHRTISTNNLLIYNPDEKFYQSDYSGPHNYGNDGGQRFDMPSTVRYGHECLKPGGYCDKGGLTRYEDTDDFTVSTADATMAYNSVLYTEDDNIAKVSKVVRNFVYLKSDDGQKDYFVVFDQVVSTNPDFKKTWLLHTVGKPEFDGTYTIEQGNEEGGSSVSYDSSLMTIPGKNHHLYSKTLLPLNPEIRLLGGQVKTRITQDIPENTGPIDISVESTDLLPDKPVVVIDEEVFYCDGKDDTHLLGCLRGKDYSKLNNPQSHTNAAAATQTYRWMVNGVDYPIHYGTPVSHFPDEYDVYGTWRIEVSPTVPKKSDVFLHVLYPAENSRFMPTTKLIDEGDAVGAIIDDRVVMFGREGQINSLGYEIDSSAQTKHIIIDLKPNTRYDVDIGGSIQQIGTSTGGVMSFDDPKIGLHTISIAGGEPMPKCSDGTIYGRCSGTNPLYCDEGVLIEKCSECGCARQSTCTADESCVTRCTDADTDSSGDISVQELTTYMKHWFSSDLGLTELLEIIKMWKDGCP